jgi:hypothetical protein
MKNIKKHVWYYSVSVIIFLIGLVLLFAAKSNQPLQSMIILLIALLYFVWSLVHHYIHHQLHPRVVIEYALIAVLGVVLSLFLFSI